MNSFLAQMNSFFTPTSFSSNKFMISRCKKFGVNKLYILKLIKLGQKIIIIFGQVGCAVAPIQVLQVYFSPPSLQALQCIAQL